MQVLLVDYGEVISQAQPAETIAALASLARLAIPEFVERYWRHRPRYDRGGTANDFWSDVIGTELTDGYTLDQLIRLDVDGWCNLNMETLDVLGAARRHGSSLSLLSNAPHAL